MIFLCFYRREKTHSIVEENKNSQEVNLLEMYV